MPSLVGLALVALSFSRLLCYAMTLPLESRDELLKCQNKPYDYYPAGMYVRWPVSEAEEKFPIKY